MTTLSVRCLSFSPNRVLEVALPIYAFKQYKETHEIQSLAGCLRQRAIEEGWVPNEAAEPSTPEQDEFDQLYADAVACGFLLDISKNHLSVQRGEFVVKINRASVYGSWTPMPWRQAKAEYEMQFLMFEESGCCLPDISL